MMQSDKDYGVKVRVPFQNFSIGRVIFPSGVYRDKLIQLGWVERVQPPSNERPRLGLPFKRAALASDES